MKKFCRILFGAAALSVFSLGMLGASVIGSGKTAVENRNITGFSGISMGNYYYREWKDERVLRREIGVSGKYRVR